MLANIFFRELPRMYSIYGVYAYVEMCVAYSDLMRDMGEPGLARAGAQKAIESFRVAQAPEEFDSYTGQIAGLLAADGDWLRRVRIARPRTGH